MAQDYFISLRNFLKGIIALDIDNIVLEITKTSRFKRLVIQLNTEGLPTSQLYGLGEDSTGARLDEIGGEYKPFTIQEKNRKGQPTDRVTLKDTGEFYMSFDVIPFKGGFTIEANTIKDGQDLESRWGGDIIGLNEENTNIVLEFYKSAIQTQLNMVLNAA